MPSTELAFVNNIGEYHDIPETMGASFYNVGAESDPWAKRSSWVIGLTAPSPIQVICYPPQNCFLSALEGSSPLCAKS